MPIPSCQTAVVFRPWESRNPVMLTYLPYLPYLPYLLTYLTYLPHRCKFRGLIPSRSVREKRNRQPSTVNRQPPTVPWRKEKPSTVNRQPLTVNRDADPELSDGGRLSSLGISESRYAYLLTILTILTILTYLPYLLTSQVQIPRFDPKQVR